MLLVSREGRNGRENGLGFRAQTVGEYIGSTHEQLLSIMEKHTGNQMEFAKDTCNNKWSDIGAYKV